MQLSAVRVFADFHCVTRWSRLDNVWSGIPTREIARIAGVKPEAKFVLASAYDSGWTTNIPIEFFLKEDSLLAWSHDGQPIPPEHGGPVRLIVPQLSSLESRVWSSFSLLDSRLPTPRLQTFLLVSKDNSTAAPKDASAVILLRQNTDPGNPEVFLVRRSEKLAFLGGFSAFPGGQLDTSDAEVQVSSSTDAETDAAISCAARELFEELGVLVARGAESLTKGQRVSLLDDLESGRMSWPELLRHYNLRVDASDFTFVGRWVTPPFSARRFDTWFFLVNCPPKQEPNIIPGELSWGEWIAAGRAHEQWQQSEILAVPPTLHALKTMADGLTPDLIERFLAIPQAHRVPVRRIEFRPNYTCFPVRTPTKPPATHTNCYLIYNSREILIIDPGSPYEDEQQALASCLDDLIRERRSVREIILTHMHPDHVGGVNSLREHLGGRVKVAAHRFTAEPLGDTVRVNRLIEDGDIIELSGSPRIALRALHTPGHARGHLCFYEEKTGTLISGDNIVGLGSVLIDPPEGNMRDYLESLRRMRALPNLSVIFGGHGPAIANPYSKLDEYISHRFERQRKILEAVREGAKTAEDIVARVYTDVSPKAHAMAARAVLAHLEKLKEDGHVVYEPEGWHAC